MLFLIISESIILSVLGLYLFLTVSENAKKHKLMPKDSIILQSDVCKNIEDFGFVDNGISLDNKRIFSVPYSAMGYTED